MGSWENYFGLGGQQNNNSIHSVYWDINPLPLKNTNLPLYYQNPQVPHPFQAIQSLTRYWFFMDPPLKSDFSMNPNNIKVFHP